MTKNPQALPAQGAYFIASLSEPFNQTVGALAGMPTERRVKLGTEEKVFPVAYLDKDVIDDGWHYDPKTETRFLVTEHRMNQWIGKFNAMLAAGEEIPAPVDHSMKATDNVGFIVAAKRVGDRLRLTYQVIGEDGVKLALRNRASIFVHPQVIDGKGRNWGEAIVHSAFTPYPVVGGMGEFKPIAASRGPANEVPLILARVEGQSSMTLTPELKKKLQAQAVGAGKAVDEIAAMSDDDLVSWYLSDSLKGDGGGEVAAEPGAAAGDRAAMSAIQTQNADLQKKVVQLSRFAPTSSEDAMLDRVGTIGEKIDLLAEKGKIKPAQVERLKKLLKSADGKPNALLLSRIGANADPLINDLLAILGENEAGVVTGGQTGDQSADEIVASRVEDKAKGGDGKDKPMSDARKAELMGSIAFKKK